MSEFFQHYPQIEYCDELSTNLLVRSRVRRMILENSVLFHPYILTEEDRPDIISHKYYGNSNYVWLLFYANSIFDPLFDWPLIFSDFNKFVHGKYEQTVFVKNSPNISFVSTTNTIESNDADTAAALNNITKNFLQLKISGTDNQGENDNFYTVLRKEYDVANGNIKLHVFENMVDQSANLNGMLVTAQYTDPRISIHHYENVQGCHIDIFSYVKLAEEAVLKLQVPTGTFEIGESVGGQTSGASAVVVGQNEAGTILEVNGLTGAFTPGEIIEGLNSATTVNVSTIVSGTGRKAVTVYEYEDLINESNREINIIDAIHLPDIINELRDIFQ